MKKRILVFILAVTFALTGCGGSKPNEELDKIANEIVMNQDTKPTATTVPTEAPIESSPAEDETSAAEETGLEREKQFLNYHQRISL